MRLLDLYYKIPIVLDIIANLLLLTLIYVLDKNEIFSLQINYQTNDISTVGLTLSGFVLTILTILISFKINTKKENGKTVYTTGFDIFLNSKLYDKALSILKKGVILLMVVSFINLSVSNLLIDFYKIYGVYLNVSCLFFVIVTFFRCFYILNLILKTQNNKI